MQLELGSAVDRYVVERLIGQGGVASVYQVRHTGLGTAHALKVVHVPSPAITERLLREGRVQGRLRHPNVVSVTDLVTVRGAPGLVMELVPGPSLDRFLATVTLGRDEADAIARGILAGVAAAHAVGLVHRDLKPGNVLIDVADGQVVPKIVDFGLAKLLEADSESPIETRAGASLGTPAYMAPEQIDDASAVDERADVFALGAILFELVAGQRAFAGDTVPAVYAAIRGGSHAPIPPDLPDRMRDAIAGALRTDRETRTPSVAALLSAWTAATPPPMVRWSDEALAAARTAARSLEPAHTPSASTFGGEEPPRTTHETWTADDVALGTTVPDPLRVPARRIPVRWIAAAGVAAVAAVAAIGLWTRPAPDPVLDVGQVPVISDDPAVQRQLAQAWEAYLSGDFAETDRRLVAVRQGAPDAPLPHLLASGALFYLGDVPEALEAMTGARTAAAHSDAPGAALTRTFEAMQLSGESVGAPLDAYIADHPRDYLAKLLGAQYCSTTSDVGTCERYHAQLLAHDGTQVAAHAARAKAWLDLGEGERARAAIADGLGIDPREPGLLDLLGTSWLAEGALDQARDAYRDALDADPRGRSPKLALATIALLTDDGTWDQLTAELLAPTVPAGDRVDALTGSADALFALGRAREGLDLLERARAIEAAEGTPLGQLTVMSLKGPGLRMRGDVEGLVTLVRDQLALVARSPEIPNPVRNRFALYDPWVEGQRAANAGDRAGLAAALDRVRRSEVRQQGVEEQLIRELGVIDRDPDAIAGAATAFWTECERQATLGEAFRRAEALDRAEAAWQAVLAAPCRLQHLERAYRVAAVVGLAERALVHGATDDAAARLAEADALWPSADPDLPLVIRREAVRAGVGGSRAGVP